MEKQLLFFTSKNTAIMVAMAASRRWPEQSKKRGLAQWNAQVEKPAAAYDGSGQEVI
jgi:hypothetical protein